MKRSLAVVAALVASVLLPAPPAPAGASIQTWTSLPPDLSEFPATCTGEADGGSLTFVKGPTGVPLGSGSLRIASSANAIEGVGRNIDSVGGITGWSVHVRPGQAPPLIAVQVEGDSSYQLIGAVDVPLGDWSEVDLTTVPLQVFDLMTSSPTGETTTLDSWPGMGHGDGPGFIGLFSAPCFIDPGFDAGDALHVDGWTFGSAGQSAVTYDFEPAVVPIAVLTNKVSSTSITKGKAVTVSTKVTRDGAPVVGKKVGLYAKPMGASTFKKVGADATNAKGAASMKVRPKKTTVYQWRYDGQKSPNKKVKVKR